MAPTPARREPVDPRVDGDPPRPEPPPHRDGEGQSSKEPGVKRSALPASTKPPKRARLRAVSDRRRKVNAERLALQTAAWGPKPWPCAARLLVGGISGGVVVPECSGPVHGHERLSRARAGRTDANLLDVAGQLPLCDGHNGWCEDHPAAAHALGLVIHSWEVDPAPKVG